MSEHAVVIAGGGPTGLMLAAELALGGAEAVIVERRTNQEVDGSRAGGLHARTMEVLDQRGVVDRFVSAGQLHPAAGFALIPLDLGDLPSRHNKVLALFQREFEPILAAWVEELGVRFLRGCEVVGLQQDADGVDVSLSGHDPIRTGYLVGCDGGRSVVRKAAGIPFTGLDASTSWMIAEVAMDGEPELGMRRDRYGVHGLASLGPDGPTRVVITERSVDHAREPTLDDLREAIVQIYGTDFGLRSATWVSRFTDATRQAERYRQGRVLLAGDAAHVHPPQGGQGLNIGVQDAVNLGWKLAQVVRGVSPSSLLDTYHDERHPIGARVLDNTMVQVALAVPDERHQALHATMTRLLAMAEPRRMIASMVSGLDVHYDLGGDHPLVGRRMPDLDLLVGGSPTRVYELLHAARWVLLDLAGGSYDLGPWADRVSFVAGSTDGPWELPVVGRVSPPPAVLIRPDGHVAWVGDVRAPSLPDALRRWFG